MRKKYLLVLLAILALSAFSLMGCEKKDAVESESETENEMAVAESVIKSVSYYIGDSYNTVYSYYKFAINKCEMYKHNSGGTNVLLEDVTSKYVADKTFCLLNVIFEQTYITQFRTPVNNISSAIYSSSEHGGQTVFVQAFLSEPIERYNVTINHIGSMTDIMFYSNGSYSVSTPSTLILSPVYSSVEDTLTLRKITVPTTKIRLIEYY